MINKQWWLKHILSFSLLLLHIHICEFISCNAFKSSFGNAVACRSIGCVQYPGGFFVIVFIKVSLVAK